MAQTIGYEPMPQGWGASWLSVTQVSDGGSGVNTTHSFTEWRSDTVINSITYTKVYSKSMYNYGPAQFQYSGGIRQDVPQEKVYFIDNQNIEHDISFNQNISLGDTVYYPENQSDSLFEVSAIDTVSVQGNDRKKFTITTLGSSNTIEMEYICGIGYVSLWGFEWGTSMWCHSVESDLLYGEPSNPMCYLSNDELSTEQTIELSPNPTFGIITFKEAPETIQIYSLEGKHITPDFFELGNTNLDLYRLDEGIYYLLMTFDNKSIIRKVVKQ